jgi:hypothetical protein
MKALTVVAASTILAVGLVAAALVLRTVDNESMEKFWWSPTPTGSSTFDPYALR